MCIGLTCMYSMFSVMLLNFSVFFVRRVQKRHTESTTSVIVNAVTTMIALMTTDDSMTALISSMPVNYM